MQSGVVFAAMVSKRCDAYALAAALEAVRFTDHDTKHIITTNGSSARAGDIERANYEVETQLRTPRSRVNVVYGEKVCSYHKLLQWLVRHAA